MAKPLKPQAFLDLETEIADCELCPRLRRHCEKVAREKKRAHQSETYWGRPVMGFGDPKARLVLVGLAPAAHGANRTGRIFTGDRSGEWLYRALHDAGFANQAESTGRDDGLLLKNAYVTCSIRCAPPDNKPLPAEFAKCAPYLARELALLKNARVFIALGSIALHAFIDDWNSRPENEDRKLKKTALKFSHGARFTLPDGRALLCSYHPSQQNTFTGRLTRPMFDSVFSEAKELIRRD